MRTEPHTPPTMREQTHPCRTFSGMSSAPWTNSPGMYRLASSAGAANTGPCLFHSARACSCASTPSRFASWLAGGACAHAVGRASKLADCFAGRVPDNRRMQAQHRVTQFKLFILPLPAPPRAPPPCLTTPKLTLLKLFKLLPPAPAGPTHPV